MFHHKSGESQFYNGCSEDTTVAKLTVLILSVYFPLYDQGVVDLFLILHFIFSTV